MGLLNQSRSFWLAVKHGFEDEQDTRGFVGRTNEPIIFQASEKALSRKQGRSVHQSQLTYD